MAAARRPFCGLLVWRLPLLLLQLRLALLLLHLLLPLLLLQLRLALLLLHLLLTLLLLQRRPLQRPQTLLLLQLRLALLLLRLLHLLHLRLALLLLHLLLHLRLALLLLHLLLHLRLALLLLARLGIVLRHAATAASSSLARIKSRCSVLSARAHSWADAWPRPWPQRYRRLTAAGSLAGRESPTRSRAEGSGCARGANRSRC